MRASGKRPKPSRLCSKRLLKRKSTWWPRTISGRESDDRRSLPVNNVDGFLQTQRLPGSCTSARATSRVKDACDARTCAIRARRALSIPISRPSPTISGASISIATRRKASVRQIAAAAASTSLIYRGGQHPSTEPEVARALSMPPRSVRPRDCASSATRIPSRRFTSRRPRGTPAATRLHPTFRHACARLRSATTSYSARSARLSAASARPRTISRSRTRFRRGRLSSSRSTERQDYGGLASHGHSGFILPAREVARMRTDVTRMYLLGFYRQSGPPVAIAAQIRDTQSERSRLRCALGRRPRPRARTLVTGVNRALVPGRNYRLWVAFNKPMRVRDANGAVVALSRPGAGRVGRIGVAADSFAELAVDFPRDRRAVARHGRRSAERVSALCERRIRERLHFARDAQSGGSTLAVLALTIQDLAESALDSNPATAADWSDGHWVRYENALGAEADVGGVDCGFKPFIALQADAAAPAASAVCLTAGVTPVPPVPPQPAPSRSGGGGTMNVLALCVAAMLCVARTRSRKRAHRSTAE